jgi:SprT-like family
VIAWLTRKFSRDPGQLGLFDVGLREPSVARAPRGRAHGPELESHASRPVADVQCDADIAGERNSLGARDPDALLARLQSHGLRGVQQLVLTRNRRTMVSLAAGVLRVHEAFADAPPDVHIAIAVFATSRNRTRRSAARNVIITFPVPMRPARRRPAVQHADDLPISARLTVLHASLNAEHFGGTLVRLEIQVSRRLARRLGHYTPRAMTGREGEIVLSRRHVKRDGWVEAEHTLLHEMVHQWQDETGLSIDHGAGFRAKCRAVGIEAAATRMIAR